MYQLTINYFLTMFIFYHIFVKIVADLKTRNLRGNRNLRFNSFIEIEKNGFGPVI